jgi:hypothetical protein
MKEPRLTNKVLDGLFSACVRIEAGGPDNLGERTKDANLREWDRITTALKWVRETLRYRAGQRTNDIARCLDKNEPLP